MLFQADIYNPDEFELAIKGCEFVFHVATPMLHSPQSTQVSDDQSLHLPDPLRKF